MNRHWPSFDYFHHGGVSVRKSVAKYEVETACACGAVFTGESAEGRQLPGFVGALEVNAHVAELNGPILSATH